MNITAGEIARIIDASVEGDPNVVITGPGKIDDAQPGTITFLGNPAYEPYLYQTKASAVLVANDFTPKEPTGATLLRVDDVYMTVSRLLAYYQEAATAAVTYEISDRADVAETATVSEGVRIGHFSVVAPGARIGEMANIHDQVYIGRDVTIGPRCIIYPGARVLRGCTIGADCIIHANAVIGADGFGFAPDAETGEYKKIPQVGDVIVEADVEIGAGATIDRASIGSTIIRRGAKLDNLVMIAHNVEVGENTVIAAQAGIAGSTKIGANCQIGGQVGMAGHLNIADGSQFQAQSGVSNNVKEPGQAFGGSPHMPWKSYARSSAMVKSLPDTVGQLRRRIRTLEKQLRDAE